MSVGARGQKAAIVALRAQAEAMGGSEAMPRSDGDVVMSEPWQGRAVALALETVHSLELTWDDFRRELIAAIAQDPHQPYYVSWLAALEQLVVGRAGTTAEELTTHRMRAAGYRTDEAGHDDLEVFPFEVDGQTLMALLTEVFEECWPSIRVGPSSNGVRLRLRPKLSMLNGYVTIGFDSSQVHLCIDEQPVPAGREVDPAHAERRCAHAELQRQWIDGAPRRWMFRLFNGDGEQQLTIVLPSPFLDDGHRPLDEPEWARLRLWDRLRHRFIGLPPDPVDRLGDGYPYP